MSRNPSSPKLTAFQKRILRILNSGQKVLHGQRGLGYLDDGSVCMSKTMLALKDMGLVDLDADQSSWRISEAGRLIGEKS